MKIDEFIISSKDEYHENIICNNNVNKKNPTTHQDKELDSVLQTVNAIHVLLVTS